MDRAKLVEELKKDEGLRLQPYRDSLGYWTIGYGHCLGRNLPEHDEIFQGITEQIAEKWLMLDFDDAVIDARKLADEHDADWKSFSDARQSVLVNMAFNLGFVGLRKFRRMWVRIAEEDWDGAAWEMLNSRWAKQVKGRATRLAKMMREG